MGRKSVQSSDEKIGRRKWLKKKTRALAWGPYLSDRQWGTVREDRSPCRDSWKTLSYDQAGSESYACGEDGLFGISDPQCLLCFAHCFYNGKDDHVKERLFGLSGPEGNHGEDVKEVYFYRTNTPSHHFMTATYMYPMRPFPYDQLRRANAERSVTEREVEIWDTGCFDDGWWELSVTYTKRDKDEMVSVLRATNHSQSSARLTVVPTVWFRNTWSSLFARSHHRPTIRQVGDSLVVAEHAELGKVFLGFDLAPDFVFLSEGARLSVEAADPIGTPLHSGGGEGTKCHALIRLLVDSGKSMTVQCHLSRRQPACTDSICIPRLSSHQPRMARRFYNDCLSWVPTAWPDLRRLLEFAYSGLLWSKQYYKYDVSESNRVRRQRFGEGAVWNPQWEHFRAEAVMSMPDKWEFPWFASWDLCLQMIPFCDVDPMFAQNQLSLLLSPSFMSPDGRLPGCEYDFEDANPPLHGLAVLNVFEKTRDWEFLRATFPRMRLNLQWWWTRREKLHRDDEFKDGIFFSSGFLGLDNISVLDRSHLPDGHRLFQCDAFVWVFLLTLNCLEVALLLHGRRQIEEGAVEELVEMVGSMQRGFRHFHDGLGCDLLISSDGSLRPLPIASYVALTPLLAIRRLTLSTTLRRVLPNLEHVPAGKHDVLVALLPTASARRLLDSLFAPAAFIGPFGVRSLSKQYDKAPFELQVNGETLRLCYCPGESDSRMFGGNSNWRGPVWLPMNFLLIDALRTLTHAVGNETFCYLGGEERLRLDAIWRDLAMRLLTIFIKDSDGRRPVHGDVPLFVEQWSGPECVLFYEFFNGDTGRGCGASHQTGWTALIANIAKFLFSNEP